MALIPIKAVERAYTEALETLRETPVRACVILCMHDQYACSNSSLVIADTGRDVRFLLGRDYVRVDERAVTSLHL